MSRSVTVLRWWFCCSCWICALCEGHTEYQFFSVPFLRKKPRIDTHNKSNSIFCYWIMATILSWFLSEIFPFTVCKCQMILTPYYHCFVWEDALQCSQTQFWPTKISVTYHLSISRESLKSLAHTFYDMYEFEFFSFVFIIWCVSAWPMHIFQMVYIREC